MYSYGPPRMAERKQDDQLEYTYSSLLSKAASSTIFFWVFGMTRLGIEPRPPEPLANSLLNVRVYVK